MPGMWCRNAGHSRYSGQTRYQQDSGIGRRNDRTTCIITSTRAPSWDDYNQDSPVDENGLSIPEYEFNQCVSW